MSKNLPENKPKPRPQNPVRRKALQRGARRNKQHVLVKTMLLSNCNPLHCFKALFHYHFRSVMFPYDHVAEETKLSVE